MSTETGALQDLIVLEFKQNKMRNKFRPGVMSDTERILQFTHNNIIMNQHIRPQYVK